MINHWMWRFPKKSEELMCVLKQQKKQTGGCKLVDLRFVSNHKLDTWLMGFATKNVERCTSYPLVI